LWRAEGGSSSGSVNSGLSWSLFDALYFVSVVLLTTGYGDLHERSSAGQPSSYSGGCWPRWL
jgi:hypothetical protein